jgi:hypothetical protein
MNNQKINMTCNIPRKSWKRGKKRVVKACSKGQQKIIHYGATGYGHNYSSLARRSFRSRHKCYSAKDKLTARYWACKNLWTKGGNTQKCPRNRKCKGLYTKLPMRSKKVYKNRSSRTSKRVSRKRRSKIVSRNRRSKIVSRKRRSKIVSRNRRSKIVSRKRRSNRVYGNRN